MTEHPIIFSGEMVRATLDGRKTQTRRIIKPQPADMKPLGPNGSLYPYRIGKKIPDMGNHRVWEPIKCPYGKVGDRLWVKESYRVCNRDFDKQQSVMVHYYSDKSYHSIKLTDSEWYLWTHRKKPFMKTSGRFMYKSLARIWLEVTNIRVVRVWDSINTKRGFGWSENPFVWVIKFGKEK